MASRFRQPGLLRALCAAALGVVMAVTSTAPAFAERSLRVGISELPAGYGNPFSAIGLPGALVWEQIFDALTQLDSSGAIVGELAVSWERTQPTQWRFELRDGVRYSDGATFDAAAAAQVFNWLLSEAGQRSIVGNEIKSIKSVRAVGPLTLVIETHAPDPILLNRLSIVAMVQPDAWGQLGIKGFAQNPVGTGSFVIDRWETMDASLRLLPNPYAWRPPAVEQADLFPLIDHASRFQALISGQLDLATSIRPEALAGLRRRGFETFGDTTKQVIGLAFDVEGRKGSPISDVRVREAINLAVNRRAIVDTITLNTAAMPSQGSFPGVFGYNPDLDPIPYQPERARQLLAAAGYGEGFELTASLVVGTYANDLEIYQMVQQDLARIGVELTIRQTVFSDWIRQYVYETWETDMFSLAWNTSPYNDAQRPMEYFSCRKARPFFCDEGLLALLEQASEELDVERREQLLFDLAERYRNAWPHLFLMEYSHTWVTSDDVANFRLEDRVPPLYEIEFATVEAP